jgi:hypothetical protein
MRSLNRVRICTAIAVIGVALLAGGAPGVARSDTGPPIASGQVVNGAGNPIPNAWVNLYVDPTGDGTVSPIATTATDANGNYTVQEPNTAALQTLAAANDGYVNFELQIDSTSLSMIRDFAMTFSNGTWTTGLAAPTAVNGTLRLAAGHRGVASMRRSKRLAPHIGGPDPCANKTFTTIDTRDNYTTVGEVHTAGDADETFTYGQSADTDTDIAIGLAGGTGPWSISGSVHLGDSTSSGSDVNWHVNSNVGRRVETQFHYIKQKVHYVPDACPADYQQIKSTGWNGGAQNGDDNSNLDHNCNAIGHKTDYVKGSGFHRYQNDMVKWSVGVVAFGIELGSRSGWSTLVDSRWSFGNVGADHYLCGSDAGVTTSHRIYAGV